MSCSKLSCSNSSFHACMSSFSFHFSLSLSSSLMMTASMSSCSHPRSLSTLILEFAVVLVRAHCQPLILELLWSAHCLVLNQCLYIIVFLLLFGVLVLLPDNDCIYIFLLPLLSSACTVNHLFLSCCGWLIIIQ